MYIKPLHNSLKAALFGGKAANLSQLISYGVAVPPGFAVSKELFHFYAKESLFPESFANNLNLSLETMNRDTVIVRSSAIGEDSDTYSFAGQLDSFVVKNNFESVKAAILKCWDGLENDRVKAYQQVTGKSLIEMGVVIQEYLHADYAGVTFTQSPYEEGTIYTEYVEGGGEKLVSGKITPKNFSVKFNQTSPNSLPFNSQCLIEKSSFLQKQFGLQLDIEWVAKDNKIYFVQARPITVKTNTKVHWSNTNLNENYPDPISPLLYSVARDSYYHYFKNLAGLIQIDQDTIRKLEYDFSNTVGVWGNRIYYNMTNIHNVLSSSPLKIYFKEAFNQFVGYSNKDVSNKGALKKSSLFKLIKRLMVLNFRLKSHVQTIEKKVSAYSKRVRDTKKYDDYKDLFYEFLDLRFNQWYHASLADLFAMVHYKSLGKFARKFYGEKSIGVHNILVQAIPGLISSEPLKETHDIVKHINEKNGARDFFLNNSPSYVYKEIRSNEDWGSIDILINEYLTKWGFRCSGELMFFKNNYLEAPEKFIELLQSYMKQSSEDPRYAISVKALESKKALRSFAWKIIKKRGVFLPLSLFEVAKLYITTYLCRQAISSRERVRYKQAEMYYRFKEVVFAIGKRAEKERLIKEKDDLLYLNYKEIGELISSSSMFFEDLKNLIHQRKSTFAEESKKVFPQHFITHFGERPEMVQEEVILQNNATEYSGLAASGGKVQGRVKILESVLESNKLNRGDILVTKQTDPGWAMVFPLIGGLIVERGGALSHGAIVAREFGIPGVIGIQNITSILHDNDEVILDGDTGKVQIL